MTADFFAIRERAELLAALWRGTQRRAGHLARRHGSASDGDGREPVAWLTGICRNPGEVSALPGGEVSLPPVEGTAEGVVVWERVASDLGALAEPIRIEVRGGRAVGDRRAAPRPTACARSSRRSAMPTTSARSGSGSTRRPASPTRSPRPRRRSARSTSRSATRPTSTAGSSSPTSISTASSWPRPSPSTARQVVVDGRHVYESSREAELAPADGDDVPGPEGRRDPRADARGGGRRTADGTGDPLVVDQRRGDPGRPGRQRVHRPGRQLRGRDDRAQPPGGRGGRRRRRSGGRATSRPPLPASHGSGSRRSSSASHRPASTGCCSGSAARTPTTPRSSSRAAGRAAARSSRSPAATSAGPAASSGSMASRRSALRVGRTPRRIPAVPRTRIDGRSGSAAGRRRRSGTRSRPAGARGSGVGGRPARRDRRRAHPGQRRHRGPPGRLPAGAAGAVRRARRAADLRRDPVRLRPHRPDVGGGALGCRPRPDDGRQGHRRRARAFGGGRSRRGDGALDGRHAHLDVPRQCREPRRGSGGDRRHVPRTAVGAVGAPRRRLCASGCERIWPTTRMSATSAGSACSSGSSWSAIERRRTPDPERRRGSASAAFDHGVRGRASRAGTRTSSRSARR